MVSAGQSRTKNQPGQQIDPSALVDPATLRAARRIYRNFSEVNSQLVQRTTGVVINQLTYRGMLSFSPKPVLLPQEFFISRSQLESGS